MENHSHHKHDEALKILKTARGQIDGIIRMIEDGRYCIDISTQLLAVISLLKKANTSVVNRHIETCVREAVKTGEVDEKIKELETLMKYIEKSL
ncbi:MAG: metal-sensing transcriptional repressor [Mesotoga infera]